MASRGDKIEKNVYTIIAEAGVALDARLFRQDVVVLPFKVAYDLTKTCSLISRSVRPLK